MGRQRRRLHDRLRRIDSIAQGSAAPNLRGHLILWFSVALGIFAASLAFIYLRSGHLLGLEVEGESLESALTRVFDSWEVSAAWLSDLADSGVMEGAPSRVRPRESEPQFSVFPGIPWLGIARVESGRVQRIYETSTESQDAFLAHPETRRTIENTLGKPGTHISEVFELPGGPCEGPTFALVYHNRDSPNHEQFVYSPACVNGLFTRLPPTTYVDVKVFANGVLIFETSELPEGFSFSLARYRKKFSQKSVDWTIELESLPFPFNWQLAFPLLLFVGITGIGAIVAGWTRMEERERLLAEAMLDTYRLTQKQSHFLAEASRLLAWHTDKQTESFLPMIAARAVPFLGVGCGICLIEGESRLRVVVAHADPAVEARLRSLVERPFGLPGFSEFLLRIIQKPSKRISESEIESLVDQAVPKELAEDLRRALRHCVAVPMFARGKPIGAVVIRMTKGRRYGARMVRVIHDFGSRIALALDNSRLLHDRQRAIRVREEFLSIASHELLTPITALQTNIQSLLRLHRLGQEVPPERWERALDVADRQVRRLGRLVHELLDVSRIDSGKLGLKRQRFDLSELVEEIVSRYEMEAERLGCLLTANCPSDAVGEWDRHRIEQVVTNLLSNALKYGQSQPVHVEVVAGVEEVRMSVADQGVGIPKEAQERIFSRFERAIADSGYGGLGLGLYIAKQIVEAHNGRIEVESEPGKGSTFTIVLPRERLGEAPSPDAEAPIQA